MRMQADKNVVVVNKQDKEELAHEDYELHEQSSEMGSDHYEEVLKEIQSKMSGNSLTDREKFLIAGINTVNIKQRELMQGLGSFFKHKLKLEMQKSKSPLLKTPEPKQSERIIKLSKKVTPIQQDYGSVDITSF